MKPMPTLLFALLIPGALVGPASAAPVAAAAPAHPADAGRVPIGEVSARITALPLADREEASGALRFLTSNCPYTRAAMLLPHVLKDTIDQLPAAGFNASGKVALGTMREGLAHHLDILGALDIEVRRPGPDDALHGRPVAAVPDLAQLRSTADPVAAMAQAIAQITPIARGTDAKTEAVLDALSTRVEATTGIARPCPRGPWAVSPGQPWTLGMELGGWRDDLAALAPQATDKATKARVESLVALLDAFGEASLASDATPKR